MNSKVLILPGLVMAALSFFTGCSGPEAVKQKAIDSMARDTVTYQAPLHQPDTIHKADANRDTGIAGRSGPKAGADSSEPTLEEIFDEYIAGYTARCTIDSSFKLATARYNLHIDHVCTFDSGIVVPKSYVNRYKLDSFVTHDFITHITLRKNGKKILERTLTKKDFWLADRPELSKYAVLFCPHLDIYLGVITLNYSISIPLTDIGVAATAQIDEKGTMRFHVED
jgi:hypothetical protein